MRSSPAPLVVDTNVALVANGKAEATPGCVSACTAALLELMRAGHLVLDDRFHILSEYRKKLSSTGQPGLGDAFLKWVYTNRTNPDCCTCVRITPKPQDTQDFHEFPVHEGLNAFDPSDRKFVAVACVHPDRPPILQAADSKWWGWQDALRECGVQVRFLCPGDLSAVYKRKMGRRGKGAQRDE